MTLSQFAVLEALYSKGDLTVGEVREKILSSVGTIPVIVNNLVGRGYVNDWQIKRTSGFASFI
ncbi:MarR family transcriptional regulator [Suipraeoptans intestinalis]|uniref:MarR family transcriptional regulator n=1 Tax=Suipraeoptans intestinalis TaxID=2606628 RepID=UPI001F34F2DF|nr:helix-turn-helix domain-containing protein [Suipraeoptans intestinalis]